MNDDYQFFVKQVHTLTGVNLRLYKQPQMERRLAALGERSGYANLRAYAEALCSNPWLVEECLDRMTINVSSFYRNYARWEQLKTRVLPKLPNTSALKVWSAACSSGEEPYTLAMVLDEMGIPLKEGKLFATDLDASMTERAEQAIYDERALKEMPASVRRVYMDRRGDGSYKVIPSIRSRVLFKRLNLLSDPYPRECDLIVCRNVLIYFTEEAKQDIYKRFARSLAVGGVLFVGSTEQMFRPEQHGFQSIEPFFYQKVV
ncbi:CheR family methyltransferase [Shouchella shacheensis]|uniref:CheR family methyltransferase n=1 Tax=Shouchella shacheensis TaxID=1649580 RepID=UPI00073FB36E|nr:protein-glutamate O-methyltransferase CheR [Shouchella shacheensis]